MKPRRSPRRQSSYRRTNKTLLPAPEPVDVRIKKARKLPMFGPGIVITVPLTLLPEYQDLYQLMPMTPGEVRDREQTSRQRKPDGVLWVRRTASRAKQVKEEKSHDENLFVV